MINNFEAHRHKFEERQIMARYQRLLKMTFSQLRDMRGRIRIGIYEGNDYTIADMELINEAIEDKRLALYYSLT